MWPVKTCLFFFGFIAACALSFVYPIVGIVNYMIVYQVNPNKWWWGIPLEPLGVRYAMTAAVCLIVGMMVSARRVPSSRTLFGDWLMLAFLFTFIVAFGGWFGAGQSRYSAMLIDKTVKMAIFLVCFVKMGGTRRNFRVILWTLVVGTLIIGYDAFNASKGDFLDGRLNFVGGVDFRESSGLAAHSAAMLPLIGVALLAANSWRMKALALTAGVLGVNTIVQCRTRSAFIAIIAGAVCAVLLAPRSRRTRVYGGLVVGLFGALWLTDGYFWERMDSVLKPTEYHQDATIQTRLELWHVAGEMFYDHPLGVGVGRFREEIAHYNTGHEAHAFKIPKRVTHNTYLLCLTELGVPGSIIFCVIVFVSLYKLHRCKRLSEETDDPVETRLFSYGCFLAIVMYLSAAAFTDRLYTESLWWVLALPVCLEQAVTREVEAREHAPVLKSGRWMTEALDAPYLEPAYGSSPGLLG